MKKKCIDQRVFALVPFLVFIGLYLGAGLFMQTQGVKMAFYQFPSVVAIFLAVVLAFIILKGTIEEKFTIFAKGAGDENILTMLIIFLLAGAFSLLAQEMGGIDAVVNLGLSLIPFRFIVVGLFLISAFLGLATGTSMGTLSAIIPICLAVCEKSGLSLPLSCAACVGGAMLGDNLSLISDTTIAATRTQGCHLKDKFKMNVMIALPAAVLTILFLLFLSPSQEVNLQDLSYDLVKIIPYVLVIVLAISGVHVFVVLFIGIIAAVCIGVGYGEFTLIESTQLIWDGFTSMNEVFFLSLFCGGLAAITAHYGGIHWLMEKIQRHVRGEKSAQLGVALLVSLADIAVANNTVAILFSGPIAKDISKHYDLDPRRTASLLDIFACILQGIIPYGAQLLLVGSLTLGQVSAFEIFPYLWYQYLLAIFAILSIWIPMKKRAIK